ncbi:TetR/AcrR family transcriptional regulator [Tumebacillus flagellatus]|uniref:Transcriptional regulator n=1 Tax=Tumebacillus flagellatus TaxID=1157490 RepID=A0A074M5U7_9BACL|nr:TetR/AcrR family transcriptional regulator [Tumebacillus flagellatus]KEO81387.1 transcriptional regulator [Tumebacillus flagellatus]
MRSEETKRRVLDAAAQLFAQRGFEQVTLREIAKAAGCSHTTIYIYYKDKEALLHELSMPPMQDLRAEFQALLQDAEVAPERKVKRMGQRFLEFCFANRNLYTVFFMTRASRVDQEAPSGNNVQKLRLELFGQLRAAMREFLPSDVGEEYVMGCARVFFYTLHGIVGTYQLSEEPLPELLERLHPTFDLALEAVVSGFQQIAQRGGRDE